MLEVRAAERIGRRGHDSRNSGRRREAIPPRAGVLAAVHGGVRSEKLDDESFLALLTVMGYLGAYAFRDHNLFEVRKKMVELLEPLRDSVDIEARVLKATELARCFGALG